jgi:hypothetical protein
MNIKELAATLGAAHPNLPIKAIESVLRGGFNALRKELEASPAGLVKCAPLGAFKVVEKAAAPADGDVAATEAKRRIMLRLADPKPAAAAADKTSPEAVERKAKRQAAKAAKDKA